MSIHARFIVLAMLALSTSPALGDDGMTVQVHAGKIDRPQTVAVYMLPPALAQAATVMVMFDNPVLSSTPRSQSLTIDGKPAVAWIVEPMKAGESRSFVLRPGVRAKGGRPAMWVEKADGKLVVSHFKREILTYQMEAAQPPEGVDKIFARGAYIHPVYTPEGTLLTNDFPKKHLHHHGIWFPWTETEFEGKKVDFWNMGKGEGTVEFTKLHSFDGGQVFASFRAQHRFMALKATGGPKPVLDETWDVRVWSLDNANVFDITSTQKCAGDAPLKLLKYHYGGMGFRGSDEWEGKDGCQFLTSEGKTRIDGHGTSAKWCAISGKVASKHVGIAVLSHPDNFRHPQKTRIHPDEPFFNYVPEADGEFSIEPGKPYVSRYRFIAFDGEPDKEKIESMWKDYADPVVVKVGK